MLYNISNNLEMIILKVIRLLGTVWRVIQSCKNRNMLIFSYKCTLIRYQICRIMSKISKKSYKK